MRENDAFYMEIARKAATESQDPNTKVGSCIVAEDGEILSNGFNQPIPGMPEYKMNWSRDSSDPDDSGDNKYRYTIHSEFSACVNACTAGNVNKLQGATMYLTLYPCDECAKTVAAYGIKEVVFGDYYGGKIIVSGAKKIFEKMGVTIRKFKSEEE